MRLLPGLLLGIAAGMRSMSGPAAAGHRGAAQSPVRPAISRSVASPGDSPGLGDCGTSCR